MKSTKTACVVLAPAPHSSPAEEHQPPTAKPPQDTPTNSALDLDADNLGSHLADRLVAAFEKLIAAKVAPNTTSEAKKLPAKEGNPQTTRVSKLEYKRVDEVYVLMLPSGYHD